MPTVFSKPFTRQEAIPEAGITRAVEIMRSGKLHRYNTDEGEISECAMLEREFAHYLGVPYCLACASGGYALHIALKATGLQMETTYSPTPSHWLLSPGRFTTQAAYRCWLKLIQIIV